MCIFSDILSKEEYLSKGIAVTRQQAAEPIEDSSGKKKKKKVSLPFSMMPFLSYERLYTDLQSTRSKSPNNGFDHR